jgi:hypothetical protein
MANGTKPYGKKRRPGHRKNRIAKTKDVIREPRQAETEIPRGSDQGIEWKLPYMRNSHKKIGSMIVRYDTTDSLHDPHELS